MKKKNCQGFALMEVLVLIMFVLIFLTSSFGAARFRHQSALQKLQKEEAVCAAEAALKLMEAEILSGTCDFAEHGIKRTKTVLEFEPENGGEYVRIPVSVWAKREEEDLILYAEAEVGNRMEEVTLVLEWPVEYALASDSNPELAAPDTADKTGEIKEDIVEK